MRPNQHAQGIQLAFESPSQMKTAIRALAKRLNAPLKSQVGKDHSFKPAEAFLIEMRNGGLILCYVADARQKIEDGIRITIPYIIVHNKRINVPETLFMDEDDGTGEDTLADFINNNWTDKIEDIQPIKPKRKVKSLNGTFPILLIEIVCILEELYEMGLTADSLPNDIADYEMAVWLRKIVGDAVKDKDKYYAFLDKVKGRVDTSTFHKKDYDETVLELELRHNKIYEFLNNYQFLSIRKEI